MKGSVLLLLLIVGIGIIAGSFAYYFLTQREEISVEYSRVPSIPKYSDITFSPISPKPGKLPVEYIDLNKDDSIDFRYSIKSSFLDETIAKICPYISYTTLQGETKVINGECQTMNLSPNKQKYGDITIFFGDKKEELKNSTKMFVVINITYSSILRALCDLYIESGYPSCVVSRNSEMEVSPLLFPNPIKLDRDNNFFIDLVVEKYAKELTIRKTEAKPLETKILRKSRDKRIEETITIDGSCKLESEVNIVKPKDSLRVCELPQQKIKVIEEKIEVDVKSNITSYFKLKCDSETVKKLKICEILDKEGKRDVLKKVPIFLAISFSATKSYSYRIYLLS